MADKFQPGQHLADAIKVKTPSDPERFRFISTVASFVATDGSQLERKVIEAEVNNPDYGFVQHNGSSTGIQRDEHIFYRCRVYAFCQGDTFSNWRTEPFVMFHPNGRFWVPPPLDRAASSLEKEREAERSQSIRRQKDQRAERSQEKKLCRQGKSRQSNRHQTTVPTRHPNRPSWMI